MRLTAVCLLAAVPATACRSDLDERLSVVDEALQQFVDSNRIAGAVGLVLRDGNVVYERAVGWADRETGRRMTTDAMFRLASQTKALTSVAAMMLVEEGKMRLDDPVGRFIPAYTRTTVASRSGSSRVISPAKRAITIRDLLTHTAGISYGSDSLVAPLYASKGLGPAAGGGWYTADKDEAICTTMERLATLPFVRQPGEGWDYGYGTDILGCVVERASGMSLDGFFRTRITRPLGMHDTYFYAPESKKHRLVTAYSSDSLQRAVRAHEGAAGQGHYVTGPRRSFSGGAGLVSTARDYARLLQLLLNGGELDGVRLLSPKSVELLTTNQVGSLFDPNGTQGFSLAFSVVEPKGANEVNSAGSYGWGGAYGTANRTDPQKRLVLILMINQIPLNVGVWARYQYFVVRALAEP